MAKWVYRFGRGAAEGRGEMRNLLGGKGAGLAEMAGLGLPVPPGFTITTEVCTHFYTNGNTYPPDLKGQVEADSGVKRMIDFDCIRKEPRRDAKGRYLGVGFATSASSSPSGDPYLV